MPAHKQGKKTRKHGRNEKKCQAYKTAGTREKNKRRKLMRHVGAYPSDKVALTSYKSLRRI